MVVIYLKTSRFDARSAILSSSNDKFLIIIANWNCPELFTINSLQSWFIQSVNTIFRDSNWTLEQMSVTCNIRCPSTSWTPKSRPVCNTLFRSASYTLVSPNKPGLETFSSVTQVNNKIWRCEPHIHFKSSYENKIETTWK